MAQSSLFGTDKDAFKNGDENLIVDKCPPTVDLIKTKTFIERAAVSKGVAKGRPA